MRSKAKKPPKPTIYQTQVLRRIAQSHLVKTHIEGKPEPLWSIDGREISHKCAQALIRNGWVKPNRDGLGFFDDTQTYTALKPGAPR